MTFFVLAAAAPETIYLTYFPCDWMDGFLGVRVCDVMQLGVSGGLVEEQSRARERDHAMDVLRCDAMRGGIGGVISYTGVC